MTITMACGCQVHLETADDVPMCDTHHERRIRNVQAPAPRFVVVDCKAEGPLVTRAI